MTLGLSSVVLPLSLTRFMSKPAGSARSTFDYYNQGYNGAFAENGRFFMINDRIWMIRYNYSEVKKPGAENHQSQA